MTQRIRLVEHWANRDLWSPYVLSRSVLRGWWCADDLAASSVTAWTDRINAIATTATSTAIPTWSATGWTTSGTSLGAAKPGVTFDGVANCMVNTSFLALPTGAVGGEVWAMSDVTTSGASCIIAAYGTSSSSNARFIRRVTGNTPTVSDGTTALNDATTVLGKNILGGAWLGTTESGRINGSAFANTATISTLATGTTRLRIGAGINGGAATFMVGTIRHVIITTTLTLTQRQQLEGWLAWDGGLQALLPVNHPYKNSPP